MQFFVSRVTAEESDWSDRQVQFGFILFTLTTVAIVSAGSASILAFLNSTTPTQILIPLAALYIGYFGIAVTIVILAGISMQSEDTPQELLSAWDNNDK